MSEYFKYLDELRASGSTNMFGAAVDLQEKFGIDRHEARTILHDWMSQ